MRGRLLFWLLWPGLFLYFRFSRRARVIIVDGDRILLVKDRSKTWFDEDKWALPGGGLRRLEKPAAGAAREVQEELGVSLDPPEFRLLWRGRTGERGLKYKGYFFLTRTPQNTELQIDESEIAVAEWCAIDKLDPTTLKIEVKQALRLLSGKL